MKIRAVSLVAAFAVAALLSGPSLASAQAITPTLQDLSLPGSPFAVTSTPDGKYAFASLSGATNGIAIIKQEATSASLVRVLPTGGGAWGLTVTRDGRYLLDTVQPTGTATAPQGMQIIDIQKAIAGESGAIVGTIPTGSGSGPIEVALSNDGRFAFVTNEDNETVSVIDFRKALESGASASSLIGNIPVDQLPVGLVFSPDGRYLYITNEDGQVAWVTARAQDDVLAFSTHRLLSDPTHALISSTPVGVAPVGIQLFDHGRLIAVADSNRFTTGQAGTVSILDYRKALSGAGGSATVGTFVAGDFPRQWGLSNNERFLYLTEFSSNTLAIFPARSLINDVRAFDPYLGSGRPFDPFTALARPRHLPR